MYICTYVHAMCSVCVCVCVCIRTSTSLILRRNNLILNSPGFSALPSLTIIRVSFGTVINVSVSRNISYS